MNHRMWLERIEHKFTQIHHHSKQHFCLCIHSSFLWHCYSVFDSGENTNVYRIQSFSFIHVSTKKIECRILLCLSKVQRVLVLKRQCQNKTTTKTHTQIKWKREIVDNIQLILNDLMEFLVVTNNISYCCSQSEFQSLKSFSQRFKFHCFELGGFCVVGVVVSC